MPFLGTGLGLGRTPVGSIDSIVLGNIQSFRDADNSTSTSTLLNFQVAAGANRKLVLTFANENEHAVTSITYGNQSFTKADSTESARRAEIWYLDSPTVGTANIVATYAGNARSLMGVISATGVAPGDPIVSLSYNSLSGTNPTVGTGINETLPVDFTTESPNSLVVGVLTTNSGSGGSLPFNPSQFNAHQIMRADSGSSWGVSGAAIVAAAGSDTYTWSASNSDGLHDTLGFVFVSFNPGFSHL